MAAAMTASISAEVGGLEGDEDLGSNPAGFSTVNYLDVSRCVFEEQRGKYRELTPGDRLRLRRLPSRAPFVVDGSSDSLNPSIGATWPFDVVIDDMAIDLSGRQLGRDKGWCDTRVLRALARSP
jgi:hypothetical protein